VIPHLKRKCFFAIYHPLYSVYVTPADFQPFSKLKECAERRAFLRLEGIYEGDISCSGF
jgi:hypothetical protein